MSKVICIVGLPGSGKSTLISKIKETRPDLVVFDDILSRDQITELLNTLDKGLSCIVADVYLTVPAVRRTAQTLLHEHDIEWIFFENAPDKCRANVKRRMDVGDTRDVEGSIRRFTEQYVIPDGVIPLEVFGGRADEHSQNSTEA